MLRCQGFFQQVCQPFPPFCRAIRLRRQQLPQAAVLHARRQIGAAPLHHRLAHIHPPQGRQPRLPYPRRRRGRLPPSARMQKICRQQGPHRPLLLPGQLFQRLPALPGRTDGTPAAAGIQRRALGDQPAQHRLAVRLPPRQRAAGPRGTRCRVIGRQRRPHPLPHRRRGGGIVYQR